MLFKANKLTVFGRKEIDGSGDRSAIEEKYKAKAWQNAKMRI
jgi:hypothetical protein